MQDSIWCKDTERLVWNDWNSCELSARGELPIPVYEVELEKDGSPANLASMGSA